MPRMYESAGAMFVACPCNRAECEVEVDTLHGLDLPWHITAIHTHECPGSRDTAEIHRRAAIEAEAAAERDFDRRSESY